MSALAARQLVPMALPVPPGPGHALDLELDAGAVCCIVGPPGNGKTAWLRTLAAIERPGAGTLHLAGIDVGELEPAGWLALRRHVGYVGATPALLSVMPANANVTLAAHYHRIGTAEEIRARAQALLERLGWDSPLDVLPAYLDDYRRLLLALARCLILEPTILFLHEPFRMMDVAAWRGFEGVLAGLARDRGLAQVLVTHNLPFVRRRARWVLFAGTAGIGVYRGWAKFVADESREVQDFLSQTGAHEWSGA